MNVTRDVISDLLPTYFSGEASRDTRVLVEEFFRNDPEFAALAEDATPLTTIDQNPKKEEAMAVLMRTKRLLRHRSLFLAVALFFSFLPFSILARGGATFILWRELPDVAVFAAVMAVLGWSAYAWTWYRVRTSGV